MLIVPITIAIIGLLGTGAMAALDHEKNLAKEREAQRAADIEFVQNKLADYFTQNLNYPAQKNESISGWDILESSLGDLPDDPLKNKGWSYVYWSDGQSYTLRYMLEKTLEEQIVFGY